MDTGRRHTELMDKIGSLVGVRERTCKELRGRLARLGYSADEVDEALAVALRVGLVDERRYALSYIRGKAHAGWGRAKIIAGLKESGVPDEIIEACGESFPNDDEELERALRELQRRSTSASDPYAALMRRLVGKGYSYEVARQAVNLHLGR